MQLIALTLLKAAYNLYEQHSARLDLTFYSGKLNGRTEKIKKIQITQLKKRSNSGTGFHSQNSIFHSLAQFYYQCEGLALYKIYTWKSVIKK
jgi:hypothetical protein